MILDSSAIIAILANEPEARLFETTIAYSPTPVRISAATYVECSIVAGRNRDPLAVRLFEALIKQSGTIVEPVTSSQAAIARAAYRDFGKGSGHLAQLNFGDVFAYALAKEFSEPLLFKGGNFTHTDIKLAV